VSDQDDDSKIYSHGKTEGYIRKDTFGRVYIDTCPTDEEHLTSPPPEGQERHTCRKYLDDILLIPNSNLGKRVRLRYEIHIERCEEN
jgi:hypothetical protein